MTITELCFKKISKIKKIPSAKSRWDFLFCRKKYFLQTISAAKFAEKDELLPLISAEKISELDKKIFDLEKDYFCVENLPDEIWKDIEGYEGIYQVSDRGRIKSFHYGRAHLMRGGGGKSGYRTVVLNKNGRSRTKLLHVLIAKTFIPNPEKKPFVSHKDGDKLNNCVENLEWVTAKENTRHAIENGLIKRNYGTDHQMSKFSDEDIKFIFSVFKKGDKNFGINGLAKKFGVNKSTIERIIKGKTYPDKN